MGLITVAEAKTYLGVSGVDDDTVIEGFVESATEAMEQRGGRHFASTAVTEVLDGTGGHVIWLKEDAESITSVKIDASRDWDNTDAEDADDLIVNGCTLTFLDHVFPQAQKNVQVIYPAGFATVPDDLKHGCEVQVAKLYGEWQIVKQGLNVLASHNVKGWSQSFLAHQGIDPEVEAIVDRYLSARI